jgi:DNA-binding GntR family transcriptional regulator
LSRSSPRVEVAYEALRRAIIEQALLPGSRLPEDQIGAHFGISRTLVRTILVRLHIVGLVDALPKRTVTVAKPTLEEAKDIFEVRRALEREAVRLTISRWRPAFGAELEGHVREEERAKAARDDRLSIRLAGEFHIKLAGMSGNRVLERSLAELVSRCSLILAAHGRPHSSECAVNEHSEIIRALREGDAAAATALMDDHVGSVEKRAVIDESIEGAPSLSTILGRYSSAIASNGAPVILATRRRRTRCRGSQC